MKPRRSFAQRSLRLTTVALAAVVSVGFYPVAASAVTSTPVIFDQQGAAPFTYTVPNGVRSIPVQVTGGDGNGGPGAGATVLAIIPVNPGDTLAIYVAQTGDHGRGCYCGGSGGWGYGTGGRGDAWGSAGGGGSSAIVDTTTNTVLVVAGGGGGGGRSPGGNGGNASNADGSGASGSNGIGGTGGAGGWGGDFAASGQNHTGGYGGGGGAGYGGGRGGGNGGGGAGGSYAIDLNASFSNRDVMPQGYSVSNGRVVLYAPRTPSTPSVTNLPTHAVVGGSFTPVMNTTGDGATSVTSSTTAVCTVVGNGRVSFVSAGTCTLVAHVAAGSNYSGADGTSQSFSVNPTTPPTSPTGVTATAGSESASVSWTASNDDGGSAITGYVVTAYGANGNAAGTYTASAPATTCTVTGLTAGVTYTFKVVAQNSVGDSPVSDPSNGVTPFHTVVAPNVPSSVTVTPGRGSLNVTWNAPTSGEPPTSYVVSIPGQPDCTVLAGQTLSSNFTGLTPGTSYTATVRAVTSAGSSSGATGLGTPLSLTTPPATPTGLTANSADGSLVVTWTAPPTGDAPTSYIVSIPGQSDCVINLVANPGAALSCTFSGLTNGTNYTATVTPSNSAGAGRAATASGTPYGTVNSAAGVKASVASLTSATVSWTAPTSIGGGSITGYTAYAYTADGRQVGSCTTTVTSCDITGLTTGTSYSFKVETATNHGKSSLSSQTTLMLPIRLSPVNAYVRGWSYGKSDITDGMRKTIGAAAHLIVSSGNKSVTVTGFANITARLGLSRGRAIAVATYLRHELDRFGGSSVTIKTVAGGCTTKFGGATSNRVIVLQGR